MNWGFVLFDLLINIKHPNLDRTILLLANYNIYQNWHYKVGLLLIFFIISSLSYFIILSASSKTHTSVSTKLLKATESMFQIQNNNFFLRRILYLGHMPFCQKLFETLFLYLRIINSNNCKTFSATVQKTILANGKNKSKISV